MNRVVYVLLINNELGSLRHAHRGTANKSVRRCTRVTRLRFTHMDLLSKLLEQHRLPQPRRGAPRSVCPVLLGRQQLRMVQVAGEEGLDERGVGGGPEVGRG